MDEPVPEYVSDLAANIQKNPLALGDQIIRYGANAGIDVLALMATRGRLPLSGILDECARHLEAGNERELRALGADYDLRALGALGIVMLTRPFGEPDLRTAADLYRFAYGMCDPASHSAEFLRLTLQSNLAAGHTSFVQKVLGEADVDDQIRWMIESDLANPWLGTAAEDTDTWLETFNSLFTGAGFAPVALSEGEGAPFDRVVPASVTPGTASGPLVTVIMSVYSPDQSLRTAVMSILNQTWQNVQLLMVDDASPAEFDDAIVEASQWDDRIELLRMPENGGTYKVRNFALQHARGEFIAFQDSDDWSHPERLERQIRPLLEDEGLMATRSCAVRLTSRLSANHVGYYPLRKNASSLLFRREQVLRKLRGFDTVRKAADSEFIARLIAEFGEDSMLVTRDPLALVQLTEGSLSRGDFSFQWHAPSRSAYREAFEYWHRQIVAGRSTAEIDPAGPRRFPAAQEFLSKDPIRPQQTDVLLVSDWREGIDRYLGIDREAIALSRAGFRPMIAHAEAPRYALRRRHPTADPVMKLFADGLATRVTWEHDIEAKVILVRDPELLAFPRPADEVNVRARRVVISASHPCRTPETGWLAYDPAVVEANARALFGAEPEWLPSHDGITESLRSEGAKAEILPPRGLGVVRPRRRSFAGPRAGNRAVVGTAGLPFPTKDRPSFGQLRTMLPDSDKYDVRIGTSIELVDRARGGEPVPQNWLVMEGPISSDFYSQLDFFVGFPMRSWGPELSLTVLEAMAHGAVVVLDPSYAPQFGDAALYTGERTPRQIFDALWRSPAAFGRQQARGHDFCAAFTSRSYRDFVTALIAGADSTQPEREL